MAATYRALAQRRARESSRRSQHHRSLRNVVTGGVIIAVLIGLAVWGGGSLAGIKTLRQIGTTPDGRPILG